MATVDGQIDELALVQITARALLNASTTYTERRAVLLAAQADTGRDGFIDLAGDHGAVIWVPGLSDAPAMGDPRPRALERSLVDDAQAMSATLSASVEEAQMLVAEGKEIGAILDQLRQSGQRITELIEELVRLEAGGRSAPHA